MKVDVRLVVYAGPVILGNPHAAFCNGKKKRAPEGALKWGKRPESYA
jgi:hypothetical protein